MGPVDIDWEQRHSEEPSGAFHPWVEIRVVQDIAAAVAAPAAAVVDRVVVDTGGLVPAGAVAVDIAELAAVDKHSVACQASAALTDPLETSSVAQVLVGHRQLADVEGVTLRASLEAFRVGWAMFVGAHWADQSFASVA